MTERALTRALARFDLDVEALVVTHGQSADPGGGIHPHRHAVRQVLLPAAHEDGPGVVERGGRCRGA